MLEKFSLFIFSEFVNSQCQVDNSDKYFERTAFGSFDAMSR